MKTDVVVIGGGATGSCVHWDLSTRGIPSLLIERGRIAGATTSKNHFNLVSGIRYILSDPELAKICQRENRILRRIAPDLVGASSCFVSLGDLDYCRKAQEAVQRLGIKLEELLRSQVLEKIPALSPNVTRIFEGEDCYFDIVEFCRLICEGAEKRGNPVWTDCEVTEIQDEVVITPRDEIQCSLIVNASGAWTGRIARIAGFDLGVQLDAGAIVVLGKKLSPIGLQRLHYPADGDAYLPVGEKIYLGTTSTLIGSNRLEDQPRNNAISDCLKKKFSEILPDVVSSPMEEVIVGIRTLVPQSGQNTRTFSRTFSIIDHGRMISIIGGKFTIARLMAEKVVDLICNKLGITNRCQTENLRICSDT